MTNHEIFLKAMDIQNQLNQFSYDLSKQGIQVEIYSKKSEILDFKTNIFDIKCLSKNEIVK
jgi:hypothetical protein